jgi:hypothetical protein
LTSVDLLKVRSGVTAIINKITAAINVSVYLVFLIIVLVFHFESEGSPVTCGNKYMSTPNTDVKKITTIFYAAFIAFFSLIMCIGLAYFGFKFVYQQIQRNKKFGPSSSQGSKVKVFSIAVIGGIAFFLHSLFILIQTSLHPNIVFNFVAILLTEIVPSVYMYYNQFSYNQNMKRVRNVVSFNLTLRKLAESSQTPSFNQIELPSSRSSTIISSDNNNSE